MGTAGDKEFAKKHYDDLVAKEKLLLASRDRLMEGGQGPRLAPTPHLICRRPISACTHHSACSTVNALMHLQPSTCQPRLLAVQQALRGCMWQLSLVTLTLAPTQGEGSATGAVWTPLWYCLLPTLT